MSIPTNDELLRMQNKYVAKALLKCFIKLGTERGWLKEGEKR